MVMVQKSLFLAERISAWSDVGEAATAVYQDAAAQFYNNPDKAIKCASFSSPLRSTLQFPCHIPIEEAEFHLYWGVFDHMVAGMDGVQTLFECVARLMLSYCCLINTSSAYIYQFFIYGAGQFINEVFLEKYSNEDVGDIWTEAEKRLFVYSRSSLDRLTCLSSSFTPNGAPQHLSFLDVSCHVAEKQSASAPWTPILSIEQGGDHAFIDAEVQRRSKSGKVVTYTITRLDRDAQSRRVFIATCDDLDVEVVFSEEEMRVMVAENQVTLPPSDDSSLGSGEY
jgi:hypothetical protein